MVFNWSEKEKAVIELLKQRKKIREIAQQLHISSRDVCNIKKKYEEEQKKNGNPNSVIKKDDDKVQISNALVRFEHGNSPDGQNNIPEERNNLVEDNQALKDKNDELTKITLQLGEENRALKHKKIELDYELKNKYIESRSGIIAVQTKSLYDDVYRLLDQDVEYCYLKYRNNRYERLVDAAQYEADRAKARWDEEKAKEEPKQENNKLETPDEGSIF